jgi:hypothetical protein
VWRELALPHPVITPYYLGYDRNDTTFFLMYHKNKDDALIKGLFVWVEKME